MSWWCALWKDRWPDGIQQIPAAKSAHLARLEAQLGLEELGRRMSRYVTDDDDWLLQHKHPLGGFIARINSYDAEGEAEPSDTHAHARIRNCPQCGATEREHDDTCAHCDWTRSAWEARKR